MKWKIYYDDGTTYSDSDGPPELAPGLGVQIVSVADDLVGRSLFHRKDYFWWTGEEWLGGDIHGLFDELQRPGYKKILFGRMIPDKLFREIFNQALNDSDMPQKSGWHQSELKPKWIGN